MNDFLGILVARINGHPNAVYPRPVSRYEPSPVSNELTPDHVELPENDRTEQAESVWGHNDDFRETTPLNRNIDKIPEVNLLTTRPQIAENANQARPDDQRHVEVDSLPVETLISQISFTTRDQAQRLSPADKVLIDPHPDMTLYPLGDNGDRIAILERRVNEIGQQWNNQSPKTVTPPEGHQQGKVDYSPQDLPLTSDKIKHKSARPQSTNENSTLTAYRDVSAEQVIHNVPTVSNNIRQPVIKVTIGRIDVRAIVNAPSTPQLPTTEKERKPANQALSLSDYLQQRAKGTL